VTRRNYYFIAAILIVGVVLFILWDRYYQRWDKARRIEQWSSVTLPPDAQSFRNEEQNPFNVFESRIYSSFWIPPEAITRFIIKPPDGYSPWRREFETFDSVHFFTSCKWPQALFCNRSTP